MGEKEREKADREQEKIFTILKETMVLYKQILSENQHWDSFSENLSNVSLVCLPSEAEATNRINIFLMTQVSPVSRRSIVLHYPPGYWHAESSFCLL